MRWACEFGIQSKLRLRTTQNGSSLVQAANGACAESGVSMYVFASWLGGSPCRGRALAQTHNSQRTGTGYVMGSMPKALTQSSPNSLMEISRNF